MRVMILMAVALVLSACEALGGGNVVEQSIGVGPEDNAIQLFCGAMQGRWTSTDASTVRLEFPAGMDLSGMDPAVALEYMRDQCGG